MIFWGNGSLHFIGTGTSQSGNSWNLFSFSFNQRLYQHDLNEGYAGGRIHGIV